MRTALFFCLIALPGQVFAEEIQFNRDVRPILSDKCLHCHGTDAAARKIRLRLDGEATAKADLGNGRRAIVPLHPEQSELIRRVTASGAAVRMPPAYSGLKLSPAEIQTLKAWVEQGAKWQKHWSFVPPQSPDVPADLNGIDYFVRSRLKREGLAPAPQADRATLIRRLSFDLTGLPPAPEEVDAFQRDSSANAWEKVVDRLLASPRYGERMAARWLDAARYADTNGYQTDAERVMWRWRDWVIDAFNANKPFDRFLVEQIAGDLLPNATPDQIIATGFNRNHRGNSEGGIVPEEYLFEYAADRMETTATVFLGVTLGCARCHNHKYDPFTQREYYQMLAYFNNVPELGRYLKYGNTPPVMLAPTPEQQRRRDELMHAVRRAEQTLSARSKNIDANERAWTRTLAAAADWHITDGLETTLAGDAAPPKAAPARDLGNHGDYGFLDRFTILAEVNSAKPDGTILSRAEQTPDGEGWSIVLQNGKLQVNLLKRKLDDSIRVETRNPVDLNGWRHMAVSYDGSRLASGIRVYLDGKPLPLTVLLDAINQEFRSREPLRIGGRSNSTADFEGAVRRIRLYRDVLAPEDVLQESPSRSLGEIARSPEGTRTEPERAKLRRAYLESGPDSALTAAWSSLTQSRRELDTFVRSLSTVMVMAEAPGIKDTFVLDRSAYDRPREKVSRGVPGALHPIPAGAPPNRLGLAMWLVDPANPLTARVTVNRIWQMYFGAGIVKTAEDFGSQGEWPANPELLDWLAVTLVKTGWDIKALHKTIAMSETYRQSSAVSADMSARDPENRLFARGPRLRLSAEMIREQALAASGLLVEKRGGPSVKPPQPAGLWSELGDKDYERDHGEASYRRSLYTFWKRTAAPPFMSTFDSALRETCVVRESRTNTPLQALNLMNDETFVEAARVLAQRAMASSTDPAERLFYAFRRVLGRVPADGERKRLMDSLAYFRTKFRSAPAEAAKFVSVGESPRPANANAPELAAYTAVASLLLNLDETLTKE